MEELTKIYKEKIIARNILDKEINELENIINNKNNINNIKNKYSFETTLNVIKYNEVEITYKREKGTIDRLIGSFSDKFIEEFRKQKPYSEQKEDYENNFVSIIYRKKRNTFRFKNIKYNSIIHIKILNTK